MPHPLWRSLFGFTTQESLVDMDMVRPWKDPWGLSHSLGPWGASTVLTDLCGCSRPEGPPQWSSDAYVGGVCHCHCGVTVAAATGCASYGLTGPLDTEQSHQQPTHDTIYVTGLDIHLQVILVSFTEYYLFLGNNYRFCRGWDSCGDPDPNVDLGRTHRPPCGCPGYLLPCCGVIEPPHGFLSP